VVGGLFVGLAAVLFEVIDVRLPEVFLNWLRAGSYGLVPVIALASLYDPAVSPARQRFDQGLVKLISTVGRLLLPLALVVLVIYIVSIPANFMRPFEERDVLVVYNVLLFAIVALLITVTPVYAEDVPETLQGRLRAGMMAVAALTVIVSVHAMAATFYRTVLGGITVNRLAVMGWNAVNIGILCYFLNRQVRSGRAGWVEATQLTARVGLRAYVFWALFLVLALPWLFPGP
jgi:hypothetical protein